MNGRREEIAALVGERREKSSRVIVGGYAGANVGGELLSAFAGDTALVVDEWYSIKKLIALEEKYETEGRKVEGVVLRKKNARKKSK